MADRIRVGVAGATGAVGSELLALLGRRNTPVSEIVPMASPDSDVHQVPFAGGNVTVQNLHAEAIARCDVVFFAVPREVAAVHLAEARAAGVPVIDLSGALDAPRVVAWVNRDALAAFDETRAVACPAAAVTALATLLHPLCAGARRLACRGLVLHPASVRGRAGIEELSGQVVALFNNRKPPQRVFPHGLAFDVAPLGAPGPSGWSEVEAATAAQVSGLLGLPPSDLALTEVVAPWFNGLCLSVHGVADPALGAERAGALLDGAPGVILDRDPAADLPRPRGIDGRLGVRVGRLRDDPAGEGFHLWAAADAVRWGVAGNAVAVMKALLEDGRIG